MSYATTAKTIGAGLVAVLMITVMLSHAADEEGTGDVWRHLRRVA